MKNVLFIVYYFPPMGGSGVQRPLKFVKYLKKFGWNPIVLCPEPGMYTHFDESLHRELDQIAPEIHRVQGNTPFHTNGSASHKQKNPPEIITKWLRKLTRLFLYPDNKKGWIEPGVKAGRSIIQNNNIDLIFSTAPPFSNHIIGSRLKKESGIPLVLDYRDAWLNNHFFADMFSWQKKKMQKFEGACVESANLIVGLDEEMLNDMSIIYRRQIPKTRVIPHGFDPEDFSQCESLSSLDYKDGKLNILYSGIFYEQNQPDAFLTGIKMAIDAGHIPHDGIHLHFQGGLTSRIIRLIHKLELDNLVTDYDYQPHDVAVANLMKADLLWMISNFDSTFRQVKSGKLFEYFGTQKPLLGLMNAGEEARLLKDYEAGFVAEVDPIKISKEIGKIYDLWKNDNFPAPNEEYLEQFNRERITKHLAESFNEILSL